MCLCGGGGHRCDGGDCSDGSDGGGGAHGSGGNSGESGMCRSGGGSGKVLHRSVGSGLCSSGWNFGVGCGFHGERVGCGVRGGGGGGSGTGGGVCCWASFEAGSVVCEWEGIFFALFSQN